MDDDLGAIAYYQPDVVSYSDYMPFGMQMAERNGSTGDYRYGFQGQEKDDEIKGEGNSVNYTFRMHDPRVGRFFAVDPLALRCPFYSPYAFSGNRVIDAKELKGLQPDILNESNIGFDLWESLLDVMGCIPVAGEVFDGINALIYTFEGDYANAAISTAAIIPVVGDLGKAGKYIVKVGKVTDATVTGGRVFKNVARVQRYLTDVAQYGENSANALWDSWKLRKSMKGALEVGEHAHHLIPVNLVKNNQVVKDALGAGYDINGKGNGIGLIPVKNGGTHAKHKKYTEQIDMKINSWAKQNEGYTPEQAKEFLETLQESLHKIVETASKKNGVKVNDIKLD
ncbi:hypothetical protein GCM10009118_24200 [Wandonia haliotis]|uniref:RHS repeat-associated core domain-containing protein n=1 Tax=Wandonia haliotis TaxID=574963 RepID=A0ABN1MRM1_9FLAO